MAAEGVHTGAHATVGSEGSGLGRVEPWSRHGVHGRATPLSPSALLSNMRTVVTGTGQCVECPARSKHRIVFKSEMAGRKCR